MNNQHPVCSNYGTCSHLQCLKEQVVGEFEEHDLIAPKFNALEPIYGDENAAALKRLSAWLRTALDKVAEAARQEGEREVCGRHGTADYYREQGQQAERERLTPSFMKLIEGLEELPLPPVQKAKLQSIRSLLNVE